MRLSAVVAGLFLFAVFFAVNNSPVEAKELPNTDLVKSVLSSEIKETKDPINQPLALNDPKTKVPNPPPPVEHIVASGETLSKIAELHSTSWQRLYAKNLSIENPDIISSGSKVIIPAPEEIVAERALPATPTTNPDPVPANSPQRPIKARAVKGLSSGNSYTAGYCTYYAKQRRPDLPNNLGNANTWVARAAAQGIPTGSTPRIGAIGQQGMHVVYVEAINGDGTIRISEMNYAGFGVISSRNASAGSFQYIY